MPELTVSDLDAVDGEPRILDLTVAERLGFVRPRAVRQLIERSRIELESYGLIATRCGAYRNRQFTEYWLSETQALLVCVLSRTERAAEVRRALIAVFTAWRRGQLASGGPPGDLTPAQRKAINLRPGPWRATRPEPLSENIRRASFEKRVTYWREVSRSRCFSRTTKTPNEHPSQMSFKDLEPVSRKRTPI